MVTRKNNSEECLVRTSFFKNTFSIFIISKGHLVKSSPPSLLQFPSLMAMFPTSCVLLQNISMDIQVNLNIYLISPVFVFFVCVFLFFFRKIVVYICFSVLWFFLLLLLFQFSTQYILDICFHFKTQSYFVIF